MPALASNASPWHVTLTTADGDEIKLISVAEDGKPIAFEGALTPVDATEQFRPGGIPREWADFSAGGGYSFYDERVPNGYAWAKNVWTLVPHAALPSGAVTEVALPSGTHGEIREAIEDNADLYFTTGRYCIKIPNGTGAATTVADFQTVSSNANYYATSVTSYLGKAYWGGFNNVVGGTAAQLIEHDLTADTFTAGATCTRWHVTSFHGLDGEGNWAQWLFSSVMTNASFKWTNSASPLADENWSPGTAVGVYVGETERGINKIVVSRQAPFILKPEGAFIVQRLGAHRPNITPHWNDTYWPYNGVAATIVGGRLYANILSGIDMVQGLDGQLNDTPQLVHPGADLPNETPAAGDTWAMCRDGDWIVAAVWNEGLRNTYVCWGKPRSILPGQPGLTNMVWHIAPLVVEGARVTWLRKSSPGGNPRLWFATRNYEATETKLYWMSLPKNGNVLQELASGGPWRVRTDTCTLYLPSNPWSQGVHSQKALRHVATVSKNASATSKLTPYASADEATRVQIGPVVTESAYVESRILEDVSGRQIAASVDFEAGSGTTPPILRALAVWAGEGIRATATYRGRFRFGKGIKLRNQSVDTTTDPQAQWQIITASQGPRNCAMTDWKGVNYTIAFEQGSSWIEKEIGGPNERRWEIDAVLTFTVLARESAYEEDLYDRDAEFT